MPFDPNQPFQVLDAPQGSSSFDASKPFQLVTPPTTADNSNLMQTVLDSADPFAGSQLKPGAPADLQFKDIAARAKVLQNWYDSTKATAGENQPDKVAAITAQYQKQRDALNQEARNKNVNFDIFKTDEENLSDKVQAAKLTPEEMAQFVPKKVAPAAAALERGVANVAGGVSSPDNLEYALVPEELAGVAAKGFAGAMAASGTEQVAQGIKNKSGEDIATGLLNIGLPVAAHVAAKFVNTTKSVEDKEGGESNASKDQETTKVHGDVRPQSEQSAGQVPVKEGSGGVQPQAAKSEVALSPYDEYQKLAQQYPSVPAELKPALQARMEALKNLPATADKGFAEPGMVPKPPVTEDSEIETQPLDYQSGNPVEPKTPAKGPGMVGLGGATPEEFEPAKEFTTSNKNAVADQQAVAAGRPPLMKVARQGQEQVWDDAMKRIDDDPELPARLTKQIEDTGKPSDNLDLDTQNAILLHRRVELHNGLNKALADLNQHLADGYHPGIEEARLRSAQMSDDLTQLDRVTKTLGTQLGRGLNARKMMANEDYSLAAMETKIRAAKGGTELTDDERKQIKDLNDKLTKQKDDYEKHIADLTKQLEEERSKNVVKDFQEEEKEETAKEKKTGKKRDLAGRKAALLKGLADRVKDNTPKEELGPWIQRLAKILVAQGERDSDVITDKVHDLVKDIIPGWTRNETMNAISGYGDFKELSKDEISVEFRRVKGELQQLGKIEDMQKGQAPLKTGVERRTPGQLERNRIKIVNEMKRKLGLVVTDPAKQLQSALGAIKTRLRHQIDDLDLQIASGKKILNTKTPTPLDKEAQDLQARRDELKKQFDEIFGKPGLTDAQRIAMADKALDRQIAEVERQLKTGEIFPKKAESKTPVTPALEAKRASLDALKEQRKYVRELLQPRPEKDKEAIALQAAKTRLTTRLADLQDRLARGDLGKRQRQPIKLDAAGDKLRAQYEATKLEFDKEVIKRRLEARTPVEKALDGIAKWRRAFVLTYPTILAKLTSASAELMAITPVEEAALSGIRKVLPKVAAGAPRYGKGFQLKTEVDAAVHTWKTLFKASAQKFKTGRSDIDLLYGNDKIVPQEFKDYIQNLHGALKEPARQNEFIRSFQKRMQFAAENGVDITDPLTQTKIGFDAYKDANAKIFMENNMVAEAFARGMTRFYQEEKSTGKPSLGAKLAGTAVKYELPIVKIPLNIAKRVFEYSFGTVAGGFRLGRALSQGLDKVTPEEKDIIMRNLARGSIGAALVALGFFNPQNVGGYYQEGEKRGPKDVKEGGIRLFGANIPRVLVHNPLLEQLQIGATIRRVMDSKLHKKDKEGQGLANGLIAGYTGVVEQTPFVQQAEESMKALNPTQRAAFLGELLKSAVPGVAQWAAGQLDQKDLSGTKFFTGAPTPRAPKTPGQYLETAIPGLRQNVPKKKPAGHTANVQ